MVLKRIVITGASGLLGRHLIAEAQQRGVHFIAVTRRPLTKEALVGGEEKLADLSTISNVSVWTELVGKVDGLIHAAAFVPSPGSSMSDDAILNMNVRVPGLLAEWSKDQQIPMVFVSGATVYANPEATQIREDASKEGQLGGLYGQSKWLAEKAISQSGNDQVCSLRPTSIYGEGLNPKKLVMLQLSRALSNEDLPVNAPHEDQINFVHAADVARACFDALESRAIGPFNIPGPSLVSMSELAQECVSVAGAGKVVLLDGDNSTASKRFDLDYSRAKQTFGYQPRISLHEGLRRTMRSMRK